MAVLLAPAAAVVASLLLLSCGGSAPPSGTPPQASGSPASGSPEAPPQPAVAKLPLALATLQDGASSTLLGGRREALLRDAAAWAAWRSSVGDASMATGHRTPDFATEVVLAVDGEDGSNGCHAVRIVRVIADGPLLRADVVRYRPGPQRACSQAMIRPCHAVALSPEGDVTEAVFTWTDVVGEPSQ